MLQAGLGMAGDTAFVIGDEAMFGVFGGIAGSSLLFTQSRMVLSQLAKLEANLRVLYEDKPNYVDILAQAIDLQNGNLEKIRAEIQSLETALDETLKMSLYWKGPSLNLRL